MPREIDADKLAAELERLPGRLGDTAVEDALFFASKIAVRHVRSTRAFKDRTGRLRRSIRRRRGAPKYRPSVFVSAGGPGARQAYLVEHGTSVGARPRPFLIPGVDQSKDLVNNAFLRRMVPVYNRIVRQMRRRVSLRSRTARTIAEGPV